MLLSSEMLLIVGAFDVLEAGAERVMHYWQVSSRPTGVREHAQRGNGGPLAT
jgi:hypothetical protein